MQTLYSEPLVAILPERHPLAGKRKLPLAKLREERFVVFSSHGSDPWGMFCRGVSTEHCAGSTSMGNGCQPCGLRYGRFHRTSMCLAFGRPRDHLSTSPVRRSINHRCRHSPRVEESCGKDPVRHGAREVWKAEHQRGRSLMPGFLIGVRVASAPHGQQSSDR
jgi:LysR substrate binding domain